MEDINRQVEAILFSCGRKIDLDEIEKLVGASSSSLKEVLNSIKKDYEKRESPMTIMEENGLWKMTVREKYLPVVRKITPYMEFSKTLMETLAVVAWKQPIIQSDVIRVRTNKAYEHIAELEKMGFLSKERHGRSYVLKLSQKFYDYFDLRNDVDVRNLFKHIKDVEPEQKKVAEYSEESIEAVPDKEPVPDEEIMQSGEEAEQTDGETDKKEDDADSKMSKVQEQDALQAEDKGSVKED